MKKPAIDNRTTRKDPNSFLFCKEQEKIIVSQGMGELHNPPPIQLLQVSKGAQKLNQMVDLWSKGVSFDGQSTDIARDLLRGSLDLQESLIMLAKLQEASKFMVRSNKKQNRIFREEQDREEKVAVENMGSNRFLNDSCHIKLQGPRLPVDRSKRNCVEELKKVIRDSLYKQNLLSSPSNEEKTSLDRRQIELLSDIPSASSSRSSMAPSIGGYRNFDYDQSSNSEISIFSTSQEKKAKKVIRDRLYRQNLLSLPSNDEKASLDRRQFDLLSDVPSASSSRSSIARSIEGYRNLDCDQKSNSEISISSTSQEKKAKSSNLIAKLMGLEGLPSETGFPSETVQTTIKQPEITEGQYQRRPVFEIDMPKARKPQLVDPKADPERKKLKEIIETMHFKGLLKSNQVEDHKLASHFSDTYHSKGRRGYFHTDSQSSDGEIPPIVIMKPVHLEREENQAAELVQEERVRDLEQREKPESNGPKIMVTMKDSSCKIKTPVSPNHKQKKNEATQVEKKANKVQNAATDRKKIEKDNKKSVVVSKSQAKTTSTKPKNPENKLVTEKKHISRQRSTSQNDNVTHLRKPILKNSADKTQKSRIKKEKPAKELPVTNSVTENLPCEDVEKETDLNHEICPVSTTTSTLPGDQLPTQLKQDYSDIAIKDNNKTDMDSCCQVKPETSEHGQNFDLAEVANQLVDHKTTLKTIKENCLKKYLLSSPSFVSSAEELFDLHIHQPTVLQTSGAQKIGLSNPNIFLDCANELMDRKSRQMRRAIHPIIQTEVSGKKLELSLDQLVEELSDGIEKLSSYSKVGDDAHAGTDSLYEMLQRDLRSKGMVVNGVWDLGWANGVCVEEVDHVVGEVEKHVLSDLMEEVMLDFVLY